jgi:hypothetical protein
MHIYLLSFLWRIHLFFLFDLYFNFNFFFWFLKNIIHLDGHHTIKQCCYGSGSIIIFLPINTFLSPQNNSPPYDSDPFSLFKTSISLSSKLELFPLFSISSHRRTAASAKKSRKSQEASRSLTGSLPLRWTSGARTSPLRCRSSTTPASSRTGAFCLHLHPPRHPSAIESAHYIGFHRQLQLSFAFLSVTMISNAVRGFPLLTVQHFRVEAEQRLHHRPLLRQERLARWSPPEGA